MQPAAELGPDCRQAAASLSSLMWGHTHTRAAAIASVPMPQPTSSTTAPCSRGAATSRARPQAAWYGASCSTGRCASGQSQ